MASVVAKAEKARGKALGVFTKAHDNLLRLNEALEAEKVALQARIKEHSTAHAAAAEAQASNLAVVDRLRSFVA